VFVEAGNLSHPLIVGEREPACGLGWRDEATEIARALLLHATSNEELAGRLGTAFAEVILASLPPAGFRLSREGILSWVDDRVASQSEAPQPAASSQVQSASRPRMRLIDGAARARIPRLRSGPGDLTAAADRWRVRCIELRERMSQL
jgi:hypothetical protein